MSFFHIRSIRSQLMHVSIGIVLASICLGRLCRKAYGQVSTIEEQKPTAFHVRTPEGDGQSATIEELKQKVLDASLLFAIRQAALESMVDRDFEEAQRWLLSQLQQFPEDIAQYKVIKYEPMPGLRQGPVPGVKATKVAVIDGVTHIYFPPLPDSAKIIEETTIEIVMVRRISQILTTNTFGVLTNILSNCKLPLELRTEAARGLTKLTQQLGGDAAHDIRVAWDRTGYKSLLATKHLNAMIVKSQSAIDTNEVLKSIGLERYSQKEFRSAVAEFIQRSKELGRIEREKEEIPTHGR